MAVKTAEVTVDVEIEAMLTIWKVLEPLTLQKQSRIFRWLADRLVDGIDDGVARLLKDKKCLESIRKEIMKIEEEL